MHLQSIVTLLSAALLLSLPGCRPCDRIEDAFNERLRDELAVVGAGISVDTGVTDHLRLTLSGPAFEYAAAPLGEVEVFRPAARQTSIRVPGAGTVLVEGELVARLLGVRAVAADDGRAIEMTLDSVVSFGIDALDRRSSFVATTARTTVRAPLAFLPQDGSAVLAIDMTDVIVTELGLEAVELPGELPTDLANELTAALVDEVLADAPELLSVLRFPRLELGWSTLDVAPSSLWVDGTTGAISLGVVTPLRPVGPMAAETTPVSAGFSVDLHPDLWRSSMMHLQAVGRMPRRFDGDGQPAITGEVGVAVDSAIALENRIEVRTTSWCFGETRCRVETWVSDGRFGPLDGRVSVALAGRGDDPEAWTTAMLAAARETAAALFNPAPLQLEAGSELGLAIEGARATPNSTRLTGSVEVRAAEVL